MNRENYLLVQCVFYLFWSKKQTWKDRLQLEMLCFILSSHTKKHLPVCKKGLFLPLRSSHEQCSNMSSTIVSGFPGGPVVNFWISAWNSGDTGLILGLKRSPGERNGNPLQYSCLANPVDGGAWQATVYGVSRVGQDTVTKQQRQCLL